MRIIKKLSVKNVTKIFGRNSSSALKMLEQGYSKEEIFAKTKATIAVNNVSFEVEEGEIYTGKVVKVEDFGCFVSLWDGCEGLVHVSQLAHERVNSPKDVVKVGDEIVVKALGYDNRGRLNLSRKDALPKDESKKEKKSK